MKKMNLAFAAFAATFTAFASNVTAYRTLIGPEGWTKPDVETGVLMERVFGDRPLSTKTPFTAVMRVTMPAKEHVRYGSLVSFGKYGSSHQITLTVVDVVGATGGSNSDTKGYIAGKDDAGKDLGFPTDDALLPKDLFRAYLTYDVALTYDGAAFKLYVDGEPVTLSDKSGKAVTATLTCAETLDLSDVCFGQRVNTVGTTTGGHDLTGGVWRDAVVFDAALSDLQVASIHDKGVWNFLCETQLISEPAKEGETYVLDSPEDWQWFVAMAPADANVRLAADLTLTAHRQVFKPVFSGTFDGNGHTLTLRPEATAQAEGADGAGLIAGTLEGATVKHLKVRVEGGVLAQEGAAGAIAGVATNATLEDVVVTLPGTLEGGAVGGVVGEASGLTLKGVRLDFSGMALGKTVGGLVGDAGALTVEGSLLTFAEGDTVDALLAGDTVGAAVGRVGEGAALAGLTLVDTCLAGATAAVGTGTPASGPTLRLAEGSALLKEGEEATLTTVRETLRTPTPTTFTVADALSQPVASEGWEVSNWDPEAKTFTLAFVGADLAAAGTLTYEVALADPVEGATWQSSVTVSHPLSNQTEDGWWELDSEPDYAWYLASCPNDSKVRLAGDITLQAKAYGQPRRFSKLEFDGQGYAITFPEGAALKSEYCGIIAGSINQGAVKDVKVVIGGTLEGENGAYIGGIFGSSAYQQPSLSVTLTNAHVHLLPTARFTGDTFNAASLVGACYDGPVTVKDCSVLAEKGATFAPSPLKYTVALTNERAKGAGTCTQANVLAVDLGVVMPSGKSAYTRVSGATTYRGCNAPKNYGSSETLLAGDVTLEAGKPATLAPSGLTVGEVTVPEGWKAMHGEGNAFTFTRTGEDDGTPCDFTYTLKQGETTFATIPVRAYFVQPVVADGDGVYNLGTEDDYAWYLKFCPRGAKVRLTADIALRPRHYGKAWNPGGEAVLALDFDGQGHTVTLPAGATLLGEYCGVIAGQLRQGAIRNVTVLLGGTLEGENGSYTGGILGSTTLGGGGAVSLANVHVRLLGTARFTGWVFNAAGLVGACYSDPVTVTASSIVAEAGATFAPRKLDYSVALTNGRAKDKSEYKCTQTDVVAVDLGIVMPSGKLAPAYSRVDGATVYKSQNVTANYGEATTILAGEALLRYNRPITLAPEGVTIAGVTPPATWTATRTEGTNAFTFTSDTFVSDDDGTPCAFTYTVTKGACAVEVPVAATFVDHPILDKDGWYNLDTEEDYAWYLAKCPNGSKVRLTADIVLQPKAYKAWWPVRDGSILTFDGQNHTITFPAGASMKSEFCGVVAGRLKEGSIKNVSVIVGGTFTGTNGAYIGGILGSSIHKNEGAVSLSNAHVRLLGTAKVTGGTAGTWRAGGLVGLAYNGPVSIEKCSVIAEAGATIEAVRDGAALTCGGRNTGTSKEVLALDLGIVMPSGKSKYTTHSGETVYKASTVTASYPTGSGTLAEGTVVAGTLEGEGPWTLAPEALTAQNVQAPEGWAAALEGNALTLTGPAGATGTLTYGLAQFPLARISLSATLPVAYAFTLPDGAQPSEALTAALEAAAQAAGLEPGAEPVTVNLVGKATLDAVELFTGICTADTETRTLTVAYDFGVTAIAVSDDRQSVNVTVTLRTASGTPAFAQGTQISLKATEGEAFFGTPTVAPGAASVQIAFPLESDTCTFRAYATRAAE